MADGDRSGFDVRRFAAALKLGHGGRLGIVHHDHGPGGDDPWVELALPYAPDLVGDPATGIIASGPIAALMDMATSMSVWSRRGRFSPHATLDLRIDYLRAATPQRTVIGHGDCYRLTRSVAFVRGQAHDGDPADPIAHVAGTFMLMDDWT